MLEKENKLLDFLVEELKNQYGEEITNKILSGYVEHRVVSLRVNTLKSTVEEICRELISNNIEFEKVAWSDTALVIKNSTEQDLQKLSIYEKGKIYLQSLS